jgi:hypothetical protein
MSVINGPYPPDPPADGLPPLGINPAQADTPTGFVRNIIDAVGTSHGRFLAHAEQSKGKFTQEGWDDLHGQFSGASATYLDAADRLLTERADEAERHYAEVLAAQSPKLDAAGEIRAERELSKVDRAIDRAEAGQVASVVRQAIVNADSETRGVLVSELADRLAEKGLSADRATDLVTEVAQEVIPELGEATRQVTRSKQAKALLGAEIARERDAQKRHGRPYVKHTDAATVAKYDPDAR